MKKRGKGKVYLVGAGPAAPGLITVRGRSVLETADCIVYDYLVSPSLLNFARGSAEKIYVGKKASAHTMSQVQINRLLAQKADQGRVVVRLKGGDPFIFGRGAEEALYLANHGIDFEVIPGVSSAISGPAYAGIPLTDRRYTSSVGFITGHEDPAKKQSSIDWSKIATGLGTLVFLMGVNNLVFIVRQLIKHGRPEKTPVALIRWGCSAKQETLTGTLGSVVDLVRKNNFKPPAVIVVGRVVNLRTKLNWFEKKVLFGKRIVVTRARAQASALTCCLEELGAEVIECPVIKITGPDNYQPLDKALRQITSFDWLILTSVNGVEYFFKRLFTFADVRYLSRLKICSIGPATSERLKDYGIIPDCQPERFVAESIIDALGKKRQIKGKKFLLARAGEARVLLPEELKKKGAKVTEVKLYQTVIEPLVSKDIQTQIEGGQIDMVTFTSSSTVNNFVELVGRQTISFAVKEKKVRLASIGPVTTAELKKYGLKADCQAREYTIPGLVKVIAKYFSMIRKA